MKQLALLISATAILGFTLPVKSVYICVSKNSKVYHLDEECFALKNCKHEIKAVSLEEAQDAYGRRLCGHED
jgi:hypothetical protein